MSEHTFLPDLEWSRVVADAIVNELLAANLIPLDQADSTTETVTQAIHLKLISGLRPGDELPP
jgi:hypothetical protein